MEHTKFNKGDELLCLDNNQSPNFTNGKTYIFDHADDVWIWVDSDDNGNANGLPHLKLLTHIQHFSKV